MKKKFIPSMKYAACSLLACVALGAPILAHEAHEHEKNDKSKNEDSAQTLTGEVVDLMCYLDHGATGEKHRECAETCIKANGPVGPLVGDKVYLVIGEHKPINDKLASVASQTVTVKGKVVERSGMRMIENVESSKSSKRAGEHAIL